MQHDSRGYPTMPTWALAREALGSSPKHKEAWETENLSSSALGQGVHITGNTDPGPDICCR